MKIVCIGQPKTATKSMAKIFQLLGFNTNSNPLCLTNTDDFILLDNEIKYYFNDDTIEKCLQNIELFEAFHDYPYSFSYEYIYSHYPDTKFILHRPERKMRQKSIKKIKNHSIILSNGANAPRRALYYLTTTTYGCSG